MAAGRSTSASNSPTRPPIRERDKEEEKHETPTLRDFGGTVRRRLRESQPSETEWHRREEDGAEGPADSAAWRQATGSDHDRRCAASEVGTRATRREDGQQRADGRERAAADGD